jgi:hypothetical protein
MSLIGTRPQPSRGRCCGPPPVLRGQVDRVCNMARLRLPTPSRGSSCRPRREQCSDKGHQADEQTRRSKGLTQIPGTREQSLFSWRCGRVFTSRHNSLAHSRVGHTHSHTTGRRGDDTRDGALHSSEPPAVPDKPVWRNSRHHSCSGTI